jgi:hypothetical protein
MFFDDTLSLIGGIVLIVVAVIALRNEKTHDVDAASVLSRHIPTILLMIGILLVAATLVVFVLKNYGH